jgi:hypothetical protein
MNFVSDNKMHGGFKNELFLGQKSDINIALALELFGGLKLSRTHAILLESIHGLKVENTPIKVKKLDALDLGDSRGARILKGALTLLLG